MLIFHRDSVLCGEMFDENGSLLSAVAHPNIVEFFGRDIKTNGESSLFYELMCCGSLGGIVDSFGSTLHSLLT